MEPLEPFTAGPFTIEEHLSVVPVAIAVGLALLLALFFWSRFRLARGRTPLIDLLLFKIPRYGYGNLVALVVSVGEFGILFVMPLWIQRGTGFDPFQTGIILTSMAMGALLSGGSARHLSAALGRPTRCGWAWGWRLSASSGWRSHWLRPVAPDGCADRCSFTASGWGRPRRS